MKPADSADTEAAVLAAALGAQYEVIRLIGRGGMARVYLAREPLLEREVAVKVLSAEVADTGDARERFLREARTAARLTHPNIVTLHTFAQTGELLYFVMSYVHGESLETRLRREARLQPEDARRIIAELADALDYAHRAGVVHRDLKPDNVMLDATTGRAMLTDFGIAKQSVGHETLTQTGMLIGTPHYMSPEQAAGDRALDGRSDLYSLGVLGYRMLGTTAIRGRACAGCASAADYAVSNAPRRTRSRHHPGTGTRDITCDGEGSRRAMGLGPADACVAR